MTTRLYTHRACLLHNAGPGHPESPLRLQAVLAALDADRFAALDRVEAPRATREQLARVHDEKLIDLLFDNVPQEGYVRVDADTTMSPDSMEAALRAAGGCGDARVRIPASVSPALAATVVAALARR